MAGEVPSAPVLLLGAAHVVDLAEPIRSALEGRALDGIAVELDPERASALLSPGGGHRPGAGTPLFARLWTLLQRRLGDQIGGGDPGEEMRVAARIAGERRLPLFLIDDPIRATLLSLVRSMGVKERLSLLLGAVAGLFVPVRLVRREMDRYAEEPEGFAEEVRRASPTIARVLIDDRNEHMADRVASLRARGFRQLAVVVGDAHLPGLSAALERRGVPVETIPFRELRRIRAPSSSSS